ncbi:MAG: DUF2442 domain-containing protein [Oscillospiraceae bacterium]|nr:DUF2442 domain-containing protein [Oscillospiraceae bacterium]
MKIYPKLKDAIALDDYRLLLTFEDGAQRIYNFKPNLNHKFYKILSDIRLFKTASVNNGEIEWVTGQDFCPHTLYEQSDPVKFKQSIQAALDEPYI